MEKCFLEKHNKGENKNSITKIREISNMFFHFNFN